LISIHLSDQEITAAAAGERSPRTAFHLQICTDCQEQVAMYRERLMSLRQDVSYSAGRSAIQWGRQSRVIQQRIVAAQIEETEKRGAGFALVSSALAIALLIAIFLFRTPPVAHPVSGPQISDAALLNDIEARMDQDMPDALQPASLLVGEMGGIDGKSASQATHSRTRTTQ
jgi:cytochrome c-type biogenesis protein CcmH/NrfG